jgi:hypothetical protein
MDDIIIDAEVFGNMILVWKDGKWVTIYLDEKVEAVRIKSQKRKRVISDIMKNEKKGEL